MMEGFDRDLGASVLVVAAHPDDEVLGCGGTIARHANSGDQVHVLVVAEGSTSRQQKRDRAQVVDELSALAKAIQVAGSPIFALIYTLYCLF